MVGAPFRWCALQAVGARAPPGRGAPIKEIGRIVCHSAACDSLTGDRKERPPIALSILTPNSSSARTAGELGWIPISGQFFHRRYLRGHWERYIEGCEKVGRRPDPDVWRVSRTMLVAETDAEAEDYLSDPENGLSFDQPKLWRRSMELLATEVMPQFSRHAEATPAR